MDGTAKRTRFDTARSYRRCVQLDGDHVLRSLERLERKLDAVGRTVETFNRDLPAALVALLRAELTGPHARERPADAADAPLSTKETAVRLGKKVGWVYEHQHDLGVVKHHGKLAFPRDNVEEYRRRGLITTGGEQPTTAPEPPTPRYITDRQLRQDNAA